MLRAQRSEAYALSSEFGCESNSFDEAGRVGDALAGDVEGGAVIDRRPDDRQAERDVDGAAEREQLHRDQPLVVIAGDDASNSPRAARANTVSPGHGPVIVDAALARGVHGGTEHGFVFVADDAVLPGMRIQPGQREPRPRIAEARQLPRREIDDVVDQLARQQRGTSLSATCTVASTTRSSSA